MASFFRNLKPHNIYIFLTLLINVEIWLGPYRPIRFADTFDSWFVAFKTSFQNLLESGFPAWDPLSLCGNHALTQPFHPFHLFSILSGLFPLWLVYSTWTLCMFFIAGFGMYLYLHHNLHIKHHISLMGSIFFFILTIYTNHSQVLNYAFPLFLYLFNKKMDQMDSFGWRHLIILLGILICAPFPLTFPFFPLFHLIIILTNIKREKWDRYLLGYLIIWTSYVLIHTPTIYSLLTEAPTSHRSDYYIVHSHFFMALLKTGKTIFVGTSPFQLIPLLFSVISLFLIRQKKILIWWAYFIFFFLVLVFFNSSESDILLKHFSILKQFQWTRLFYVTHFFIISILATYGLSHLDLLLRRKPRAILPPLIIILCLTIFTWHQNYMASYQAAIMRDTKLFLYKYLTLIIFFIILTLFNNRLYAFIKRYSLFIICFCLLFFLVFEKYVYFLSFETEGIYDKFRQKEIQKLALSEDPSIYRVIFHCHRNAINECLSPGLITYHGLQTPAGYQSLYPLRYKHLWSKIVNPSYPSSSCINTFNRMLLWGNRLLLPFCPENSFSNINLNLLSLLNVKYILTTDSYEIISEDKSIELFTSPSPSQEKQSKVIKKLTDFFHPIQIWTYKNNLALPRSFIVSNWEIFDNAQHLLSRLERKNTNEHLTSAALFKPDLNNIHLPAPSKKLTWSTHILLYKPNFIKLRGSSSSEGILILTDTFHKNWRAFLNNKPLKVFPVNYIFRGVLIPKGSFQIEFKYQDGKLFFSYLLFFFGIFILFLFHKLIRV